MAGVDLKKTISILYDMELNNYYVNEAIKTLDWRINNLGYEREYKKPVRVKESVDFDIVKIAAFIVGVLGGILGAKASFETKPGLFIVIVLPLMAAIGFGLFAIFGVILGFIIDGIIRFRKNSAYNHSYKINLRQYERQLHEDNQRVNNELAQRDFLIEKRNLLANRLYESQGKLADFYYRTGIDSRFCNLVSMGYMNEFIKLGIANKLGGADGLYHLIMQELRWDQMQCSLDDISRKLDTIIDNQRMIYSDIKRMNRESSRMIDRLINGVNNLNNNVNDLKAIEEYNGARIARELEFQNYMMYIK